MLDKTSQKATRIQKNSIMTPINQLNVIDIYQTLHLKENIHFFFQLQKNIYVSFNYLFIYMLSLAMLSPTEFLQSTSITSVEVREVLLVLG